jgi:hypothetical protein
VADVKQIIIDRAKAYGEDPDTALRIAKIESSLNPSAKNPRSSAGGLFQFIDGTWKDYGRGKSKFDPVANADAGIRLMQANRKYLARKLGREPTAGELYMAHQQGAGGAGMILSNPDANAVQLLGRKRVLLNGGNETMTAGEFAQLWTKKIDGAQVHTGPVVGGVTPPASMPNSENPEGFNVHDQGTISYADVVPTENLTASETAAREQAMEDQAPSFIEGAKIAAWNEMSILAPFRTLGGFEPDPNYKLTEDRLRELGQGIPDQYLEEFADAISDQHAEAIRGRLLQQLEANQKLASMGATGVMLSMGAAMLDPGAILATAAIGAATGGLGIGPAVAARLGRAGLVGLGAAEGIAGNLATDIPLVAVDPTRGAADLKWSIGTGLLMGGAFGALKTNSTFAPEAAAMAKLGKQMQDENVEALVRESLPVDGSGSMGAAQVLAETRYRADTDDLDSIYSKLAEQVKAVGGNLTRFDVTGQLMRSKNPMTQTIARYLGEDAVRAKKGSGTVTQIAATERQSRMFRVSTHNWVRGYDKAWKAFRKKNQVGFWQAPQALAHFKSQVTDYIREVDPSRRAQFPAEVRQAGEVFSTEMKTWWKRAQEEGLVRSEIGAENYFPRYPDLVQTSRLINQYGYGRDMRTGGLASLFRDAILAKQKGIDPELAHKMAYAMVDRFNKLEAGENLMDRANRGLDLDDLEEGLKDYLTPDEIANVKAWVARNDAKGAEKGGNSRLMQRVIMDENFMGKVKNRVTGAMEDVRVADFYVKDPNLAFHLYARQMSGQVALAQIKVRDTDGKLLIDGIKNAGDWEKLKQQVTGVGQVHGANTEKDLDNLDFLYSAISGAPYKMQKEGSDWATGLRLLRDFNFARLMGQVGFSQLPEFGRMSSQVGLKALYQGFPGFRNLYDLARHGKMTEELADELDAIGAFGTDWMRGTHHIMADDFGTPVTLGGDTLVQRGAKAIAPVQHKINRAVSALSFMAPVNGVLQRWGSRSMAVKFVRMAMLGDKINAERMRALGLDQETLDLIFDNIRKHAQFKGNVKKPTKLTALGLKNWDGKAVAAFEDAMYRANRTMILENDPGQFAKWMGSPLGKTVMQFRSFVIGSWTKATLQGLNLRDTEAALGFLTSSMIGALVYMGQTRLQLLNDPDRERKMEERLSWSKLAAAAFQRTSESSLITMPADIVGELFLGGAIFDTRSSGLNTTVDNWMGNPTGELVSTGFKAVKGISSAVVNGDDFSAPDFKNLTRTLPFQNLMTNVWFFNWLSEGLPKREMRE